MFVAKKILEETMVSNLAYDSRFYHLNLSEACTFKNYDSFKNWLAFEFDLFFKEEIDNGLIIYIPNGSIKIAAETPKSIAISVRNKNSKACYNTMLKVYKLYILHKIKKL